jgi:transcriptional/translational regulatory protein YebC/TACO1
MAPTSYLFERKGLITLESTSSNKSPTLESLLDTALDLDLNVEDARLSADSPSPSPSPSEEEVGVEFQFELITPLSDLQEITQSFSKPPLAEFWAVTKSEVSYEPLVGVEVLPEGEEDGDGIREDKAEGLIKLVDALEIEQDISKVWTNLAR